MKAKGENKLKEEEPAREGRKERRKEKEMKYEEEEHKAKLISTHPQTIMLCFRREVSDFVRMMHDVHWRKLQGNIKLYDGGLVSEYQPSGSKYICSLHHYVVYDISLALHKLAYLTRAHWLIRLKMNYVS